MFSLEKNDWHIKIENEEQYVAARSWLLNRGFRAMYNADWSPGLKQIDYSWTDEAWIRLYEGEDGSNKPEVKFRFKTAIEHVEYPQVKTESQLQLEAVMSKLSELQTNAAELQKEAQRLQEIVAKENK